MPFVRFGYPVFALRREEPGEGERCGDRGW